MSNSEGGSDSDGEHQIGPPTVLKACTLEAVAEYMKSNACKNVFVMIGAGMSVAAGIPDFRSPSTGLYSNLDHLGLPYPQAVFELAFFKENPKPFYAFAEDFDPTKFRPTLAHSFIRLLDRKQRLRMAFTQNIDGLERRAHIDAERLVEAHGTIVTQHCVACGEVAEAAEMWAHVRRGEVYYCPACDGAVKPDIVFFGEALPERFARTVPLLRSADLLLVLGTSLTVHPFASLTRLVPEGCPRVLFNLERAGDLGTRADDVLALETCDSGVRTLAHLLGWEEELDAEWAATALPKDPATSEGEEDEVRKLTEDIGHALRLNESDETSGEVEDKPAPADEVKFPNSADEKDSEASVPKQEKSISSADNGDVREGKL